MQPKKILSKKTIRQSIRCQRRALTSSQRKRASDHSLKQFKRNRLVFRSRSIAGYIASDGEISTLPILRYFHGLGRRCYVPVLHPFIPTKMYFCRWTPSSPMQGNRFGILEPRLRMRDIAKTFAIGDIITPLVAFDRKGNRLGMGGGFYDRVFSHPKPLETLYGRSRKLGAGYQFQEIENCPREKWDQKLDGVLTDCEFIDFR